MFNSNRRTRAISRLLGIVAVGVLLGLLTGLLINWQLAPAMVLMYFVIGWAAQRGQKQKKDTDAYREQWLRKRKNNGVEPEA